MTRYAYSRVLTGDHDEHHAREIVEALDRLLTHATAQAEPIDWQTLYVDVYPPTTWPHRMTVRVGLDARTIDT